MRIWIGFILLLLGVITTIGVSWWCARYVQSGAWPTPQQFEFAVAPADATGMYHGWQVHWTWKPGHQEIRSRWSDPGIDDIFLNRTQGDPEALLPGWLGELKPQPFANHLPGKHVRRAMLWGWPLPAMYYTNTGHGAGQDPPFMSEFDYQIEGTRVMRSLGQNAGTYQDIIRYPLMPAWPGFLVNTLVYAVIWLVLLSPLYLFNRRRIRRRRVARGLCPGCGYDLSGGEGTRCPECGATHQPVNEK